MHGSLYSFTTPVILLDCGSWHRYWFQQKVTNHVCLLPPLMLHSDGGILSIQSRCSVLNPLFVLQRLVVKPDQLIKRRGKLGLVGVNLDLGGVREWLRPRLMKETTVRHPSVCCLTPPSQQRALCWTLLWFILSRTCSPSVWVSASLRSHTFVFVWLDAFGHKHVVE